MHAILDNADEKLLFSAVEGGHISVMQLLHGYGADLAEQSTEGESAAILAAKKGDIETVRLLGDAGVDLRAPDADGNTAWKGQMENVKVLRRVGADLNLANNDGNQCLIGAAMNDQPMVLNYLLDEARIDADYANDCQETATFWAASNGCVACLRVLVEHSANLEKCDKYGINGSSAQRAALAHKEAHQRIWPSKQIVTVACEACVSDDSGYYDRFRTLLASKLMNKLQAQSTNQIRTQSNRRS